MCRADVASHDLVRGPICGHVDLHPMCTSVAWHQDCRAEWLADLETWAEVAGGDT